MSDYDKQKDIEAEGQRAAIYYNEIPKVGACAHEWDIADAGRLDALIDAALRGTEGGQRK